ncbi:MAG TPA: hypothetical protein VGS80_26450 [Ktedonobacterales bacterium]|nr:hypothetical protein [Ktedonobacterales bacterium]
MSRRFDTAFSIAVGRSVVGILGLAVADVLRDVSTVSPTRTTVVYWGLVAISLALVVIGSVWLVVLRARLRRHIAGRQAALDEAAIAAFRQDWRTGRSYQFRLGCCRKAGSSPEIVRLDLMAHDQASIAMLHP